MSHFLFEGNRKVLVCLSNTGTCKQLLREGVTKWYYKIKTVVLDEPILEKFRFHNYKF